jgi:hypothetical protein
MLATKGEAFKGIHNPMEDMEWTDHLSLKY